MTKNGKTTTPKELMRAYENFQSKQLTTNSESEIDEVADDGRKMKTQIRKIKYIIWRMVVV